MGAYIKPKFVLKKVIAIAKAPFTYQEIRPRIKVDQVIYSYDLDEVLVRLYFVGMGHYETIELPQLIEKQKLFSHLSKKEKQQLTLLNIRLKRDSQDIAGILSARVMTKTYDPKHNKFVLNIEAKIDGFDQKMDVDPTVIARDKEFLSSFNGNDAYQLGYAAAENWYLNQNAKH